MRRAHQVINVARIVVYHMSLSTRDREYIRVRRNVNTRKKHQLQRT